MAATLVPEMSQNINFSDGNILLDVIEGNRAIRFRVHKSLLSLHSRYFQQLLNPPPPPQNPAKPMDGPQPPRNPSLVIHGYPLISFPEDLIGDWQCLLESLYNPFFNQTQTSAPTIIAMLRLGKKYQFTTFLENAEHRLRRCYPSSLPEFRSREQIHEGQKLLQVLPQKILPDDILPVLFYDHLYLLDCLYHPKTENTFKIPCEGLKTCLSLGKLRLLAIQEHYTFGVLRNFQPECDHAADCTTSLNEILKRVTTPVRGVPPIRPFITLKEFGLNFCHDCEFILSNGLEEGALEVWGAMAWCFGLGSWEVDQPMEEEVEEKFEDGED